MKPEGYSKQRDSGVTKETSPSGENKEERGRLKSNCALVSSIAVRFPSVLGLVLGLCVC
ncbi:rCG25798 [Rattus norvegicus]|uniref:RCG25798 n=1 Tax=Rattus norvegicus TaxID=10116 RepID=A6I1D3_RAT|nr:rCG25798 [Rattus norvegicus]